ncbi:uncharacterized protein isoform X2 [Rhodnius prolixus]
MRRLPPHGKEKCSSPRVTLRLHQLKEKRKDKLSSITGDHHDSRDCRGMDAVNKNGNSAVDDVSGGKETTGNNCDENGTGATAGDQKENGVNTGAISNVTANSNTSSGEGELHHHGADRLDTSSAAGGATVKRSHSTDEDDDSKKKRRKDDGSRGKSGSNSGGSPKSLIGVESEGEDAKSVESPGPKVPPLKIVISGASLEEPGPGGRNGKNGSGRHHLPYVVSTTATTATNNSSPGSGGTTAPSNNNNNNTTTNSSNNNGANSTDTANSNVGGASESQSGGSLEEPVGPRSPADEPVTSPSSGGNGGTTTGRGHQRVLRSHRSGGGGGGAAGKEERCGSGGSNNGGSGHSSPAGMTTAEGGSPRGLEGASPSPGAEGVNTTGSSTIENSAADDKGNSGSSSTNSNSSGTIAGEARVGGVSIASSDESPANTGSQANTTAGQVQTTVAVQQSPNTLSSQQTELHPRKRKMRPKENLNNNNNSNNNSTGNAVVTTGNGGASPASTTTTTTISSMANTGQSSPSSCGAGGVATNGGSTGAAQNNVQQNGNGSVGGGQSETNSNLETAGPSSTLQHLDQSVTNSYQLFLNIRKQIERKRKGLFPVQPKPPQGFKDYLMNRCTYVLASNATNRVPPPNTNPPANLHQGIKDLYIAQEKERHRLLMQHVIEKEKLVLSVEQEILRVHGRAARALANQALPFSACTILRDEEVYSAISPEQEEKDRNQARSRYNGRLFLSWLQDVDDKWEKIKESMLVRHHNEAESLHAVQKMDWEWKMKELGICELKSNPVIEESHVPMVHVSDDFDLLPA